MYFFVSIIGVFSEQARRCRCVWQYTTKLTITSPLSIPHCFGSSNTKYSIPRKHSTIPAFMWMPACGPCHKTTETNSPLLCAAQPESVAQFHQPPCFSAKWPLWTSISSIEWCSWWLENSKKKTFQATFPGACRTRRTPFEFNRKPSRPRASRWWHNLYH